MFSNVMKTVLPVLLLNTWEFNDESEFHEHSREFLGTVMLNIVFNIDQDESYKPNFSSKPTS